MTENWKAVPGHEGRYEVSDLGRVRSLLHRRVLSMAVLASGHISVKLARQTVYVHHLVLLAFVACKPVIGERVECRHLDGNPANNLVSNLRWGTVKENRADRRTLFEVGAFSALDVRRIRNDILLGTSIKTIASKYGVDRHTISNIKAGKTYAYVLD
jgi:hypothetical protein